MSNIDKYIDWSAYWENEIKCQIENLEDYEPILINTDIEEIKRFLVSEDVGIFTEECYIDDGDVAICFADGEDEEAVSLWFTIDKDDLISRVEMRG